MQVYNAVTASPSFWRNSVTIVTYDEHGGLYDHVNPPATVNPGDQPPNPTFNFERLGVRVPAVLVSPFIKKGTILGTVTRDNGKDMVFDHTSAIATARKLFIKDFAGSFLTQRDRNARTFEDCLTLDNPRSRDEVKIPQPTKAPKPAAALGLTAGSTGTTVRTARLSDRVVDILLAGAKPVAFGLTGGAAKPAGANTEESLLTKGFSLKAAGLDPSTVATDPINEFQVVMLHHIKFAKEFAKESIENEQDAAKTLKTLDVRKDLKKASNGKRPSSASSTKTGAKKASTKKASTKKAGTKKGSKKKG